MDIKVFSTVDVFAKQKCLTGSISVKNYALLVFLCISQDQWPRDGVLRVEIIKNVSDRYNITESYRKEYGDNLVMDLFQVPRTME